MNQADFINFSLVGSADKLLPVVLSFLLLGRWFFFFLQTQPALIKMTLPKMRARPLRKSGQRCATGECFCRAACKLLALSYDFLLEGCRLSQRKCASVCVLASVRLLVHPAHCLFPAAQSRAESVEQGVLPTLVISLFLSSPSIIVSLCRLFFF